jgi:pectate lyase
MYAQPAVSVPDGYATQNGGTTGGSRATPVTVKTASAFKAVVENDDPAVIIVKGKLNVGSVNIDSNKTIIGADVDSGLYGGTIKVRGSNNNYYNSAGNGYCIGTGFECHIRLENTCFENITSAWREQAIGALKSGGEIGWNKLIFKNCSQPTYIANKYPVFTPPYSFTTDEVEDVKHLVTDPVYGGGNRLVRK